MKHLIICLLAIITITNSCKKSTSPASTISKTGTVNVFFNNLANGTPINLGAEPSYITNLGQKFSVNILKYYISNIRLTDDKGVVTNLGNFTLINEDKDIPKREVSFSNLPNGNYTSITFNYGLDKITNALPLAEGDLDHSLGMWWGTAKYLFLKHEGYFMNNTNVKSNLLYHVGTDEAFVPNITFPISGLSINGDTKTIMIDFNFEKMYTGIDFNLESNMMSDGVGDKEIVGNITTNIQSAFSFNKVK